MRHTIKTIIRIDESTARMDTKTVGFDADEFVACEKAAITYALAAVCRASPLGFEACMERICKEAMNVAKNMGPEIET